MYGSLEDYDDEVDQTIFHNTDKSSARDFSNTSVSHLANDHDEFIDNI
jgi:hypothetical protein